MCILLVEDELLLRTVLTEAMTEHVFAVFDSADGESALMANRASPPQLIVSDVNLGHGMDGFEFVTLALCRWPLVPVILMSGFGPNFDSRSRGETQRFLSKPFSLRLFLQNVIDLAGAPVASPAF